MKKVIRNYRIVLFLLIWAVSSCVKDTYDKSVNQENSQILAYVKIHPEFLPVQNSGGLYYMSLVEGTGDTIAAATDYVSITYNATYLDGTLFDTTDTTTIPGSYPSFALHGPYTFSMGSNFYGLVEGISLIKREGGTARLIIPSTLSFNDFKPRIYEVTLRKVYHNIAAARKLEFDSAFMVPMGFALKDSTAAGRWIDTSQVKGTGTIFPVSGDTIAIKYTGRIMDSITNMTPGGRIFEQYDSAKTIIGSAVGPIFYEALTKMKIGGKAKVYVPYYNAYGANITYNSTTGQIVIPPYSNVMYNIEFVGFVNNKGLIDKTRN